MNLDAFGHQTTLAKSPRHWLAFSITMLGLSGIVVVGWQFRAMRVSDGQKSVAAAAKIITVTVLGRLEPHGEMIYLTAPTSTQENRIDQKKAIASR